MCSHKSILFFVQANRGFDNEEVQEYKDVFEYFDSKKTGFITAKNMATTLRSLKPQPDEYLVEEKQEEIIRDYGGQVNFQQYLDVLHNIIRKAKKKKRKRVSTFRTFMCVYRVFHNSASSPGD